MPFTASHAAVALPFVRTPLVPAAVAVGAMTPNLPLFVRGTPLTYASTHDWVRLPVTIGVALVLLLVWRCLLRPAVRELSPRWLASRLPGEWDAGARASLRETLRPDGLLWLLPALAIGVASHILWDSFTHEGRWGVVALGLDQSWGPLPAYKWLQHGSSVLGLVLIGGWMLWWLSGRAAASVDRVVPGWVRWAWWLSLPAALVVAWGAGLAVLGPFTDAFTPQHLGYRVLPPAVALWGALTLALCVAVQAVRTRRRADPATARRRG